ncbi:MAG: hypothetical protein ACREC3_10140 [Methyloceanibacter sp.]
MAGRYTGSYLDRSNGWRAVATLADIGQASLVGRIPKDYYTLVEVVSTSASDGETDIALEHLYVAEVPQADIRVGNCGGAVDEAYAKGMMLKNARATACRRQALLIAIWRV